MSAELRVRIGRSGNTRARAIKLKIGRGPFTLIPCTYQLFSGIPRAGFKQALFRLQIIRACDI
jgi:hypothetical protein